MFVRNHCLACSPNNNNNKKPTKYMQNDKKNGMFLFFLFVACRVLVKKN
jgi:hypothetical protein